MGDSWCVLYGYVQNNPVNFIDPDGLTKKGLNYDPNWKGRPILDKPRKLPDPMKEILPKNYKPKGINNVGDKIPTSPSGKLQKRGMKAMKILRGLAKILEIFGGGASNCSPLIMSPIPPEALSPTYNPKTYSDNQA